MYTPERRQPVETWYEDVDVPVTSPRLYSTGAVIVYTYDREDPEAGPDLGHDLTPPKKEPFSRSENGSFLPKDVK